MPSQPRVTTDIRDHVAHVTLNRADKMNALDHRMAAELVAAGHALMDSDVRAVVLSGAGRSFCAGLDVARFAGHGTDTPHARLIPRTYGDTNVSQEAAMIWHKLPVPVIAALHGVAYGAGLQLALGADIRIAAPDARLAVMELKWGLVPDMGGMALLPRLVRSDVLRLLTYTATPVAADQALTWGLVTEIAADPLARATDIATEIAGKSPSAIRAAKRLIARAESGAAQADILLAECCEQAELIGKPHQSEVIRANMAGEAPKFT